MAIARPHAAAAEALLQHPVLAVAQVRLCPVQHWGQAQQLGLARRLGLSIAQQLELAQRLGLSTAQPAAALLLVPVQHLQPA